MLDKLFQFKDGDMPVPADTLALIDLNINSHHCSRIIERIDKKFELTNSYERYGAAIMIVSQHFLRSDARLPPVLTKLRTVFNMSGCQTKGFKLHNPIIYSP